MTGRAKLRLLLRIGVVLAVLAAGIAGNVLLVRGQNDLIELVIGAALVTLVGLFAVERVMKRPAEQSTTPDALDKAADALAEAVGEQWSRAALERGLVSPTPVPVLWVRAHSAVTGPLSDAIGTDSTVRFPPLPGITVVSTDRLACGGIRDLFAVYAGLDSGRLIIIGSPGTGKTGAAIVLVTDALKHRDGLPDQDRRTTPVPVLLNCRTWEPTRHSFAVWLAEQLKFSYRFLRAADYGADAADRLVAQGRIAVVLDGFDETSMDVRPAILESLNSQARCRLVLLSRKRQLVSAARHVHLAGAAALQLEPVAPEDAASYLARCRVEPPPKTWQRLVDQVRLGADAAVVGALNKPLTLTLVRDTFHADADAVLLAPGRFTDSAAVEEFLLDRVIPAAYRVRPGSSAPRYTEAQAMRWLGCLADRMTADDTYDLAWWHIPAWQPSTFRAVANGLLAALVFTATGWVTFGPRFAAAAAAAGFVAGCVVGAFAEWRPEDRPVKLTPIRWRALGSPGNSKLNRIGLVTGLGYGIVAAVAFGLVGGTTLGLAFGVAVALSFQFSTAISILTAAPYADSGSPIDPITGWRRDRDTGIVVGVALALPLGFVPK